MYYLGSKDADSSDAGMFNGDVILRNLVIGNVALGSRSLFPFL